MARDVFFLGFDGVGAASAMMDSRRTYLDYNATSPLRPGVRDVFVDALSCFGNPSSVHTEGRQARALVAKARKQVADLIGGQASDVSFCGSATEALNMVIRAGWDCVITLASEHAAVLEPAKGCGADHYTVGVTPDGLVDLSDLAAALARAGGSGLRTLVCVQAANNETGVLQPIDEVAAICREAGALVLCDAVQVAGKLSFDVTDAGVDFAVISAHKLGGMKGVGAVWARPGLTLAPLVSGGGQEKGLRGGTENVAAIAAFGAAAEIIAGLLETKGGGCHVQEAFETSLLEVTPGGVVVGQRAPRLPNTTCIAVPGRAAETLVIGLDLAGFAVSAGAACSSGKVSRSHVLDAMGLGKELGSGEELSASAIRISWGWETTQDDLDRFISVWSQTVTSSKGYRQVA
ncbi:MAG: cysteine desulfurase family protein [Pseudomonadota bacterium]